MKTTRYFKEQVPRKRPYLREVWCKSALKNPFKKELQPNGRIRFWIFIPEYKKYLRVVTLGDRATNHNTFFDRNFKEV